MRVDEQCKVLCRIESLSSAQGKAFRTKIDDDYRVNMYVAAWGRSWLGCRSGAMAGLGMLRKCVCLNACCCYRILDNLPVAMVKMRKDDSTNSFVKTYERGFPVGFTASLEVWGQGFAVGKEGCSSIFPGEGFLVPVNLRLPPSVSPCLGVPATRCFVGPARGQVLPAQPPAVHHPVSQGCTDRPGPDRGL